MSEIFGTSSDYPGGLQELSDAQSSTAFAGSGQDNQDNYARAVANILARPQIGGPARSNIRNAVNYDPLFAQALNIRSGLLPGNQVIGDYRTAPKFQGIADLNRPSNLRPSVDGIYFSQGEKFIDKGLTPLLTQGGIMGLIRNLIDYGKKTYDNLTGEKGEDGIMDNLDRADLSDTTKAILDGMEKENKNMGTTDVAFDIKSLINPGTATKALGMGINYFKPQIESMLPSGAVIDAGPKYIIDDEGEGKFNPRIDVKIPVENMGLNQLLKAIG